MRHPTLASVAVSSSFLLLSALASATPDGGAVTVLDAVQAFRAAAGVGSTCDTRCDLDGDGAITDADGTSALIRAIDSDTPSAGAPAAGGPRAVTSVDVQLTFTATTTLQGLQIEVEYPAAKGDFHGSGGAAACLATGNGFFFVNDNDSGKLVMNKGSAFDLTFPFTVTCSFDQNDGSTLTAADLTTKVVEVVHDGAAGDPATLQIAITVDGVAVPCGGAIAFTTKPGGEIDLGATGRTHHVPFPTGARIPATLDCSGPPPCQVIGDAKAGEPALPPLPISGGGVPFCIVSTTRAPVAGTFDCDTHCSSLLLDFTTETYLVPDVAEPCPRCVGDVTSNDGARNGTCDGGKTPGAVCDAQGDSAYFGPTSNDCLPSGASVGEWTLTPTLATNTQVLAAGIDCLSASAPAGACHCPNQVLPNFCLDGVCSANGVCENGPLEPRCTGEPFRSCDSDSGTAQCEDLAPGAGTCVDGPRSCFPSTITRTGTCGEDGTLAGAFCIPPTRAPAINTTAGLPGPAALDLPIHVARTSAPAFGCSAAPHPVCRQIAPHHATSLLVNDAKRDSRDEIAWRFLGGEATPASAFGNPGADTDYALCLYSATPDGYVILADLDAPAGGQCGAKPCWRPLKKGGFVYRPSKANQDGIVRIELVPGLAGKSRVVVRALGPNIPLPTLPLSPPITVQVQADNGECWESTYENVETKKSNVTRYRAISR